MKDLVVGLLFKFYAQIGYRQHSEKFVIPNLGVHSKSDDGTRQ